MTCRPIVLVILACVATGLGPARAQDPPPATESDETTVSTPIEAADAETQATLTEGFESERPNWRQEDGDAAVRLLAHDRSERARHGGQRSEHFQFTSEGFGSSFYYSYPLPRVPVTDELEVSLYVRANQPGVQLLAQVVLPADTDPDSGKPLAVSVAGSSTDVADRWQRLDLKELRTAVERQVRLLRFQTKRPIPTEGAYLDRVIVNLFTGGGETEVFLDDLRVSPVPKSAIAAGAPELAGAAMDRTLPQLPVAEGEQPAPIKANVRLEAGRLTRDGREWVPTILRAPGADLATALPFGFDVVSIAADAAPNRYQEALRRGALLMPDLGALAGDDRQPPDPATVLEAVNSYPASDAVAFWEIGSDLGVPQSSQVRQDALDRTRAILEDMRARDGAGSSLITATVGGEFNKYTMPGQSLDLLGVDPGMWGRMRDPAEVFEYLKQRRDLTALWNLNAPYWGWVDAAVPSAFRTAVWGGDAPPPWGLARVQPEQARVSTYLTLMSGYRGVGFHADAELTRPGGLPLLYELAMLNAEIDLVEPYLARGADPIQILSTYPPDPVDPKYVGGVPMNQLMMRRGSYRTTKEFPPHPSIKAAAISGYDPKSRLILITDMAGGSQWQPGQLAFNDLKVVVPGAPSSAQAFEIRLGGGRWLERDRVPGGVRFTLPEFGVTSLVLLTTDLNQGENLRRAIERIRPRVVDLALRQARQQVQMASEINARLALDGVTTRDSADLLGLANRSLLSAEEARNREDYELAWDESRRVSRPLRILMRAYMDQGLGRLAWATALRRDQAAGIPPLPWVTEGQRAMKDQYADARRKLPPVLVAPISSPPLTAWQTLPQHFVWIDWVAHGTFGQNLVQNGTFDQADPEALFQTGWRDASYKDPQFETRMELLDANGAGDAGRGRALKLSVSPKGPAGAIDRSAAMVDHPVAAVETPAISVKARQFLRISVLVKLPRALPAGGGGLIVRDSVGGPALEFRTTAPIADWSTIVLYRRVPVDGELRLTLGLAGYGEAYFDDVRVEQAVGGELASRSVTPANVPGLPAGSSPAVARPDAVGTPGAFARSSSGNERCPCPCKSRAQVANSEP